MPAEKTELPLRIVVDDPVPGVALALQKGKGESPELIEPARATAKAVVFELSVTATTGDNGALRLLGPFVQGPPAARFLYICVGTYAGQAGSPWARRIKVPLTDITATDIAALGPRKPLEAHIAGRNVRGEPAAASVKLAAPGWKAVS